MTRVPHVHELAHFALTAKYYPELGYTGLYEALAGALEHREGRDWIERAAPRITDLSHGGLMTPGEALRRFHLSRPAWKPARWDAFVQDVAGLERAMARWSPQSPEKSWATVLADNGCNFPPSYLVLVRPLVGMRLDERTLPLLAAPDVVAFALVIGAAGTLWGAWSAAAAAAILASSTDLLACSTWSLARFDWLGVVALALLALARGRAALGGALWGFAAALKLFPALPAALFALLWIAALRRSGERPAAPERFSTGFCAAAAGVLLASTAALASWSGRGWVEIWSVYLARIVRYSGVDIVNRVGLPTILSHVGLDGVAGVGWPAGLLLAGLLAAGILRSESAPDRMAAVCLLVLPLLWPLGHYTYLMLPLALAPLTRQLIPLAAMIVAINVAVSVALRTGVIAYMPLLAAECLALSLALAAAPLLLFIDPPPGTGFSPSRA